jgi:DNA-binding GntR family transcriptional regulator
MKEIPLDLKIADILQKEIKEKYSEGERLPSEASLCYRFKASRYVVRKALSRLVQMGLINSRQGVGYFVAGKPLCIRYSLTTVCRYSDMVREMGLIPAAKLLKKEKLLPPEEVKDALKLSEGEEVYKLEILRYADGVPLAYSFTWLPTKFFEDFLRHTTPFFSLYEIIERVYGVRPLRMNSVLQAVFPTAKEALYLEISSGTPLLQISSIVKDEKNRRVEYTESKYRGDLCRVSIDFNQ